MADASISTVSRPRHVAIIMDGNGRWAEARGQVRMYGHEAGVESVRAVTRHAARLGLGQLTLFAFSTENWRRPREETDFLFGLSGQAIMKCYGIDPHEIAPHTPGRILTKLRRHSTILKRSIVRLLASARASAWSTPDGERRVFHRAQLAQDRFGPGGDECAPRARSEPA